MRINNRASGIVFVISLTHAISLSQQVSNWPGSVFGTYVAETASRVTAGMNLRSLQSMLPPGTSFLSYRARYATDGKIIPKTHIVMWDQLPTLKAREAHDVQAPFLASETFSGNQATFRGPLNGFIGLENPRFVSFLERCEKDSTLKLENDLDGRKEGAAKMHKASDPWSILYFEFETESDSDVKAIIGAVTKKLGPPTKTWVQTGSQTYTDDGSHAIWALPGKKYLVVMPSETYLTMPTPQITNLLSHGATSR